MRGGKTQKNQVRKLRIKSKGLTHNHKEEHSENARRVELSCSWNRGVQWKIDEERRETWAS